MAAGRASSSAGAEPAAGRVSSGLVWGDCRARSQAAALFLMAPTMAVRIAPPAPPATACETIPLTLKFPDCAAARTEGSNRVATCPSSPPPTRPEMMFPAMPRSNVGDDLPAPTPPRAPAARLIRICSMSISWQKCAIGQRDSEGSTRSGDAPQASRDEAIDEKQDDCANHASDEAGGFSCTVPPDGLTEIGCNKGADDSQNGRQDEALRLRLVTGHNEFGNDSNDKPDNDGPKDAHFTAPALTGIDRNSATAYGRTGLIQI